MNMGFIGWYQILVIGLKFANIISWSWWWVLLPIWIIPATFVVFMLTCIVFRAKKWNINIELKNRK